MNYLDEVRQRIKERGGKLSWDLPLGPVWVDGDPLLRLWVDAPKVFERGELTFGRIYMANGALWESGESDAPGGVIYSFEPGVSTDLDYLVDVADRIYGLYERREQGVPLVRPWERRVQDQVVNDVYRTFHQRLPPMLCDDRVVYHSTVMIFRRHLPQGYLTNHVVPLLVDRSPGGVSLILPHEYWPRSFLV